jgi:hypothetical protein
MTTSRFDNEHYKYLTRCRVPRGNDIKFMVFDGKRFVAHKLKPLKLKRGELLYKVIELKLTELSEDQNNE